MRTRPRKFRFEQFASCHVADWGQDDQTCTLKEKTVDIIVYLKAREKIDVFVASRLCLDHCAKQTIIIINVSQSVQK